MAGFIGYTVANEIYDFLYRGQAITIGANLYLRLLTVASSRSGGGTETNYTGYSRLILPRGTTIFGATVNGLMANTVQLAFPTATSLGNGDLVAFDIVDTASGAVNKIYNGGPISPSKAIVIGKAPTFRVGALEMTL